MTPIPGARSYSIDTTEDPPVIYTRHGLPRRPNHKGAVAIWCDDGIRRCRTLKRWAALATHREEDRARYEAAANLGDRGQSKERGVSYV